MAFTQPAYPVDNNRSQPRKPTLDYVAFQTLLDQVGEDTKNYLVSFLAELAATSASYNIGHDSDNITANNVGGALEENRQAIVDVVLGDIPDGSLTDIKLSNEEGQIKDTVSKNTEYTKSNARDIGRIELAVRKNGIISGQYINKYFESPEVRTTDSIGLIDFGKTYSGTVNTGTDTLVIDTLQVDKDGGTPTNLSDCFYVGEEITLQDGTNKENLIISNVDDGTKTLTFTTNIVGTFASGANAYRSNMIVNGTVWNFGAYDAQTVIDITTPEQVVNAAYSTQGNGGRKIDTDSDANVYEALKDGSTIKIYKRGTGLIYTGSTYSSITGWSLEFIGGKLALIICRNGNRVTYVNMNLDGSSPIEALIDDNQTSLGECSIKMNSDGTKITATWSSKNSTYPNSFNIRAIQGTISSGVVTWGSVEQITNQNSSGYDYVTPSVVYGNNDKPQTLSVWKRVPANEYILIGHYLNGSNVWTQSIIYNPGNYIQSNPSATFIPSSVATKINASYTSGLIVVAWDGKDSTDTSKTNIRCKASSDNGVTWFNFGSSNEKITTGNTYTQYEPTVSWNNLGDVFILWNGWSVSTPSNINIRSIKRTASTGYGPIEEITSQTTSNIYYPNSCDNYHNYEKPLTIWKDNANSDIKLYGKWIVGTQTPTLSVDTRININQPDPITSIQSYLRVKEQTGLVVDAKASIVASASNESYADMTDTTQDLGTVNEISSSIATTINKKATVKYSLTRALTTDVIQINDVVGFVGV